MVPIPWQQFSNPALGHICDASEHVGQPCLWINVIELGRHDQRGHCRCSVGAAFGAGEQPRLATECKSSKSTLGCIEVRVLIWQIAGDVLCLARGPTN